MLYKTRTKSEELVVLEILGRRKSLSGQGVRQYQNLAKGYEGEVKFDRLTEGLGCECYILNDLLLNVGQNTFQIDTLIVAPGTVYFYEVKNFEGDYYYEDDRLFTKSTIEVNNPLLQLARSESLLRQLLLRHGFNFHIDASVVFINPTFTLYQAQMNKPIIFPTQVRQYLQDFNATSGRLTAQEERVAERLLSMHNHDSPYVRLPTYDYQKIQKGIICRNCFANAMYAKCSEYNKLTCRQCKFVDTIENGVLRSIHEFKTLFPNEKITTNIIHDWCRVVKSKRVIHRILLNNFEKVGERQWTHYK